jgi:hypothetical protein
MVTCLNIDSQRKQLCFENFPNTLLNYQETAPAIHSDLVQFEVMNKETRKVFSVFMKGADLQRLGISLTTWKSLTRKPEQLRVLIENTNKIDSLLEKAANVASKHLTSPFLEFFTIDRKFANRVINKFIHEKVKHSSGIKGVPGMYFHSLESFTHVFINLKKTLPLGVGSYGKVKKVLWLSAPEESSMLAAKKVFQDTDMESNCEHFNREKLALHNFSNKTGIISLIAGGIYENKYAIFLPIYEFDLHTYFKQKTFSLTIDEKLSMISQWLEGLTTISEKGVHGDISSKNLLFKRLGEGKIEAVISDFGTFHQLGKTEHGLTTINFGSPEYFANKIVTPKLDVWSLGISLHRIFSKDWLPSWWLPDEAAMAEWTSKLSPSWVLEHPTDPQPPQFLLDLINLMLDPRPAHRPSPKEAFELFSKGLASYNGAIS